MGNTSLKKTIDNNLDNSNKDIQSISVWLIEELISNTKNVI